MHPYISQMIAAERFSEMQTRAADYRRASEARASRRAVGHGLRRRLAIGTGGRLLPVRPRSSDMAAERAA